MERIRDRSTEVPSSNWEVYKDAFAPPPPTRKVKAWERAPVAAHAPRLQGQKIWKKAGIRQRAGNENDDAQVELEKAGAGSRKRQRLQGAKENIGNAYWLDVKSAIDGENIFDVLTEKDGDSQLAGDSSSLLNLPRKRTNADHVITPRKALAKIPLNDMALGAKNLQSPGKPQRRKSLRKSIRRSTLNSISITQREPESAGSSFLGIPDQVISLPATSNNASLRIDQDSNISANETTINDISPNAVGKESPVEAPIAEEPIVEKSIVKESTVEERPSNEPSAFKDIINSEPVSFIADSEHVELINLEHNSLRSTEIQPSSLLEGQSDQMEINEPSNTGSMPPQKSTNYQYIEQESTTIDPELNTCEETPSSRMPATPKSKRRTSQRRGTRQSTRSIRGNATQLEENIVQEVSELLVPLELAIITDNSVLSKEDMATCMPNKVTPSQSASGGSAPDEQRRISVLINVLPFEEAGTSSEENTDSEPTFHQNSQIVKPEVQAAQIEDTKDNALEASAKESRTPLKSPQKKITFEAARHSLRQSKSPVKPSMMVTSSEVNSDNAAQEPPRHNSLLSKSPVKESRRHSSRFSMSPAKSSLNVASPESTFDNSSLDAPHQSIRLSGSPVKSALRITAPDLSSDDTALESLEALEPIFIPVSPDTVNEYTEDLPGSTTPDPTTTELVEAISHNAPSTTYDHDDTDMLRNFLTRVKANKAAKAEKTAPKKKKGSFPHSPLQLPLGDSDEIVSPSSPRKDGFDVSIPTSSPSKRLKTSDPVDEEPRSIRRSGRTRLPIKAPPAAPSFIPVRRLGQDGDNTITLRRSEEKELAALTRLNTRKNKGAALPPSSVLAKKGDEKDDPASRQRALKDLFDEKEKKKQGKRRKTVVWAEELAQFQAADGKIVAAEPKETKEKVEEKLVEEEKKSSIPRVGIRSKLALGMAANGTPAPKRKRGRT